MEIPKYLNDFMMASRRDVAGVTVYENYFLRVIPTVKHYPDIASDIPSGSIYGIFIRNIRTFYLTCILTLSPAFYLASFLAQELVLMVDAELFL